MRSNSSVVFIIIATLQCWMPFCLGVPMHCNESGCELLLLTSFHTNQTESKIKVNPYPEYMTYPPHRAASHWPWLWWWWCSAGSAWSADSLSSPENGNEMPGRLLSSIICHTYMCVGMVILIFSSEKYTKDIKWTSLILKNQIGRRESLAPMWRGRLEEEEEDVFPQ